jgi:drug/metabolite transporter (DMT)-like permease
VGQFHPLVYVGLRLGAAGLGYVAIYALGPRSWPSDRQLLRHAATLGVFGTAVPMSGIVTSLQYQSSGITSILITLGPVFTVIMAHFFLEDESLNRRKAAGVALALGGALLLAVRGESGLPDMRTASPTGYGLVLLAMVSAGGATVYARRFMRNLDAFDVASVRMVVAALIVLPLSVFVAGIDLSGVDTRGYWALGYATVIGTFGGILLAFTIIKRFGATASAMMAYVIPIVATIGGVLILDEQITAGMLAGMGLIVFGVVLIQRSGRPQ